MAICARGEEDLQVAREAIKKAGGEVLAAATDVTKADEVESFVQKTLQAFGTIDVLC